MTSSAKQATSKTGIVIPAYNEAGTIAKVIQGAAKYGIPIVVDDGSSDQTYVVAIANNATVVRHALNQGYDKALDSGFTEAHRIGCTCVVTLDADGQHDPYLLRQFLDAIDEGADVVLGIRDKTQRLAEKVFAYAAKIKFGIDDPLCGMKAYRIGVYEELGHFDSYNSIGTELAIFAARKRKKIVQLPFKTRDRTDSPRFGKIISANIRIFKALWRSL